MMAADLYPPYEPIEVPDLSLEESLYHNYQLFDLAAGPAPSSLSAVAMHQVAALTFPHYPQSLHLPYVQSDKQVLAQPTLSACLTPNQSLPSSPELGDSMPCSRQHSGYTYGEIGFDMSGVKMEMEMPLVKMESDLNQSHFSHFGHDHDHSHHHSHSCSADINATINTTSHANHANHANAMRLPEMTMPSPALTATPPMAELVKRQKRARQSNKLPTTPVEGLDYNGRRPRQWKNRKYKCSHCSLSFYDQDLELYAQHVAEIEAQPGGIEQTRRKYKCEDVDCPWHRIGFIRKLEAQKHFIRKHGVPQFECRFWAPDGEKYPGSVVCTTRWHADSGNRSRHENAIHGAVFDKGVCPY